MALHYLFRIQKPINPMIDKSPNNFGNKHQEEATTLISIKYVRQSMMESISSRQNYSRSIVSIK